MCSVSQQICVPVLIQCTIIWASVFCRPPFGLLLPLHELLPEQANDNFLFARAPQCALGMLSKPCVLLSLYCQLVCSHLLYCPPCFWEECKNSSNILASFQNYFWLSTIFTVLLSSRNLKLLVLLD